MITDSNGDELTYWPISGLVEGDLSETLDFTIDVPTGGGSIIPTVDSRVYVWAKKVGDASFTNISLTPYDLTGLSGSVDFQCYVEALSPIEGLEMIPIAVTAGTSSAAGWVI